MLSLIFKLPFPVDLGVVTTIFAFRGAPGTLSLPVDKVPLGAVYHYTKCPNGPLDEGHESATRLSAQLGNVFINPFFTIHVVLAVIACVALRTHENNPSRRRVHFGDDRLSRV